MVDIRLQHYNKKYYYTDCGYCDEFLHPEKFPDMGWSYRRALEIAQIDANSNVLDIGCGRGEVLRLSALKGARTYGVDYSPDAVEIAQGYIKKLEDIKDRVSILCADCKKLDFPNDYFTHIFMLDIVEHLYPEELKQAFFEAKRVLKKGGTLIIHTNPNRLYNDYGFKYYSRFVNFAVNKIFGSRLWTHMSQIRPPSAKILHINEQSSYSLKKYLSQFFKDYKVWVEFSWKESSIMWKLLNVGTHFYPLSVFPPLNQLFCNWIWAVAKKK